MPDLVDQVFNGAKLSLHERNVQIEVAVVQDIDNMCIDELAQEFGINNEPRIRIRTSLNRNQQFKIMPMPILIGTLSKNLVIPFLAPGWIVKLMCCVEMLFACEVKYWHKEWAAKLSSLTENAELCMMKILLTAATPMEMAMLAIPEPGFKGFDIICEHTGIGLLATTYHLTDQLRKHQPDLVIQVGIAGTLRGEIPLGDAVVVENERVADMGVWENGRYKDIFQMGLVSPDAFPYTEGGLKNPHGGLLSQSGLRGVTAVTVNEITTQPEKIEILRSQYAADLESMEGAALHYVCLLEKVPFLQVRGISNLVGERDKSQWKIKEAMNSVSIGLQTLFNNIENV